MSKVYILQKNLPDSKEGDEYIWNESMQAYYKNGNVQDSYWKGDAIENNPSWFKLKKEEKTEVTLTPVPYLSNSSVMIIPSSKIPSEKYEAVKKAIEFVLQYNEHPLKDSIGNNLYTKDDLLKAQSDAFYASREIDLENRKVWGNRKYPTFPDYIESKKQKP